MANKFNIVIGATDRASAVVKNFNARIDKIFKPLTNMQKSFTKLGKEIGNNKIVKGLASMGKGALQLISKFKGVTLALAGVSAAAGAVQVAKMARDWAVAGSAVGRTASIIGIGTTRLQTLSGAAQVFGLDAADMQAGLKSLGDTMEDALYGRNQDALILMQRLGIRMKRTKDGAVDTAAGLMDIARAITRIKNVQAQGLVARTFGMEGLLPLLQKGPAGIAELERLVRATKAAADPGQIKRMTEFQQKVSLLQLAIKGLGNTIGDRLLPFLTPATDKLIKFVEGVSDAIAKHKEMILLGQGAHAIVPPKGKKGLFGGSGIAGTGVNWDTGGKKRPVIWNPWHWFDSDPPPPVNGPPQKGVMNETQAQALLKKLFPGVDIRSGFRDKARNKKVGGKPNSYHLIGNAIDFRHVNKSRAQIAQILRAAGVPITELLDEGDHMHWAWGDPRRKANGRSSVHGMLDARNKQAPGSGPGGKSEPAHVVVSFKNAPPGTDASVKKQGSVNVGLRVDYSLPTVASP